MAFLVDMNLYLFEHQSTVNRNMPLRFLQYVSAEYKKLTAGKSIYRDRQIKIPAPHFIVFYNGTINWPEQSQLKLSDAFLTEEAVPELELLVRVLNQHHVIYLSRFLLKIRDLLFLTPNSKKLKKYLKKDLTSLLKCAAFFDFIKKAN